MSARHYVGRVSGLAIALGIGAALAAGQPATAWADSTDGGMACWEAIRFEPHSCWWEGLSSATFSGTAGPAPAGPAVEYLLERYLERERTRR